jgi:uncharacterized protein YndB with AHSA1/START domain
MLKGHIATVTSVIHSPIERVWKALTDPEELSVWMMGAQVRSEWKVGSAISWEGQWQGSHFRDSGEVLKVQEPDLLQYSHISGAGQGAGVTHIVTIELKEVGGVTHLRLTQDNNPTEEARDRSQANWTAMIDAMKKMLGEAPVPKPTVPRA